MISCPWCGTTFASFQPNCRNCGGPLPAPRGDGAASFPDQELPMPPAAPRAIRSDFARRLMSSDGAAIAGFVLGLLGGIFGLVGIGLTLGGILGARATGHAAIGVTALVGIPFLLIGLPMLGVGGFLLARRYRTAQRTARVLREGDATVGQITQVEQNYSVKVNGRHPWRIGYCYQADGQSYDGRVSTLNEPGPRMQVGAEVRVLYLADEPQWSSIYPHP